MVSREYYDLPIASISIHDIDDLELFLNGLDAYKMESVTNSYYPGYLTRINGYPVLISEDIPKGSFSITWRNGNTTLVSIKKES